jgi:hypothetical protein
MLSLSASATICVVEQTTGGLSEPSLAGRVQVRAV